LESFFAKKKYVKKYLLLSAFAFCASLASKAFSILLLSALLYFYLRATKGKMRLLLPGVLLLLALPFYLFAQSYTGSFFFSTQVQASQLSALEYVWQQIVRLPYFFVSLFFTRDYTSPLLGLLPIALFSLRHSLVENKQLRFLSIFTLNQLAIWWFVPPLSTRYALAGFISGLLIVLVWLSQRKERFLPLLILALSLLLILPRIIVAQRSSTYLLGKQTKQEFITSQTDENNRSVLESWYQE